MIGTTAHSSSFASVRRAFTYCSRADTSKNVRSTCAAPRRAPEQSGVHVVQRPLPDRGRGLQLLDRGRAHRHPHAPHAERDRAGGDERRRAAVVVDRADLAAHLAQHVRAHVAGARRPRAWSRALRRSATSYCWGTPGYRANATSPISISSPGSNPGTRASSGRPSTSAAPRCRRAPRDCRGRGGRPAARSPRRSGGMSCRSCARRPPAVAGPVDGVLGQLRRLFGAGAGAAGTQRKIARRRSSRPAPVTADTASTTGSGSRQTRGSSASRSRHSDTAVHLVGREQVDLVQRDEEGPLLESGAVAGELAAHRHERVPGRMPSRGATSTTCTSRLRALDVREELVAEARALRRALDQPRDVGDHELAPLVVLDRADRGLERRERIVRDLGLRAREAPQQR